MNDKDTLEFEDRFYVSPTVSRDEQMEFIDNYRNVLQDNVQRVNTQTHNLGTDVPSNIGGLTGAGATFETRYVTPQANAAVAELRRKTQETALTHSLTNLENQMNQRYKQAYRNARINEYNKSNSGGGNGGGDDGLGVDTVSGDNGTVKLSTDGSENGQYSSGRLYPARDPETGSQIDYLSDYLDSKGQWWQLSAVKNTDIIPNQGYFDKNEDIRSTNGSNPITFMYIDNDQVDGPTWFRAVRSAGPGTYSPKARN